MLQLFTPAGFVLAEGSLIDPQPGLAFWTVVTFLIVAVVLRWKVWGPLMRALDEREKTIQASVEQAQHERRRAETLVAEQQQAAQQARAEAAEMLRRSQADIEKARDQLLVRARAEADELVERARKQIEEEKRKALADIRDVAVDLALGAAEKLVAARLDDAAQRRLAEEYVGQLQKGVASKVGAA